MEEIFLKRCRACSGLQECSEKMISLFEKNICGMFSSCTSLEISMNDCLPSQICFECFGHLSNFNKFREKCVSSDTFFREQIVTQLVKIEPLDGACLKYEEHEPNNCNEYQEVEPDFYETEYIDEELSQYDPDSVVSDWEKFFNDNNDSNNSVGVKFICDYCDLRFYKKNHIASHMLKHKNEVVPKVRPTHFPCNVEGCTKIFQKRKSLTSHKLNVHKIKTPRIKATSDSEKKIKLFCQRCTKWFTMQHKLDAHVRREHEGQKPYKCSHCDKEFCKNRTYVHHIKVKHSDIEIEKYRCSYDGCNKEYELHDSLKVHIRRFHLRCLPPPRNQKLICDQCGKSFKNSFNLKEHSYLHSGLSPFACDICPKKFLSNYKLKIHTMRHLKIKPFVCRICGLGKTTNKELQAHLNFHSKEITYPCKECPRVFASYSAINRHVRIHHRNHKPYICPHCQRAFAKAETMKNHVMTHTGEKPFACSECGHRFIQSVALKAHMKVHAKKLS